MTETLYRKTWEPLAEADKSEPQVVRPNGNEEIHHSVMWHSDSWHIYPGDYKISSGAFEFLCLEPVEVVTDEVLKVV